MKVDNYALTMFQTCPLKYQLRMREHWSGKGKSAALGFGGALHEGLAAWYKTGDIQAALHAIHESWPEGLPADDYRNETKCLQIMAEYVQEYPHEPWQIVGFPDDPMVEVAFTLDTGLFLSCFECGVKAGINDEENPGHCSNCAKPLDPLEYGGIFDGLIEFQGLIYVLDHKSTSRMDKYYFSQFKPNNQMTGYTWGGANLTGRKVGGAYINAIGVYKSQATKFERHVTTRTPGELDEWMGYVLATCEAIRACERSGVWPMHTPACTLYGLCEYHKVHVLFDEPSRLKMLEQDFTQIEWDYENRP